MQAFKVMQDFSCDFMRLYDSFLKGAKSSFEIVINIFPSILAMILGVNIFINNAKDCQNSMKSAKKTEKYKNTRKDK